LDNSNRHAGLFRNCLGLIFEVEMSPVKFVKKGRSNALEVPSIQSNDASVKKEKNSSISDLPKMETPNTFASSATLPGKNIVVCEL
jgi:hypothetical protein